MAGISVGVPQGSICLAELVDELAEAGRGVVMTMGKGGVGKTTIAAAVAVALARRGFPVRLSTTDPAAHLADALAGDLPGLDVTAIDPATETEAYSREVLATAGAGLDSEGLALLEEDLRSPCTEEVAVFRAFARTIAYGDTGFVVLDTAPTGHTLLLLDAAQAYHREVQRNLDAAPDDVVALLPRLRDPGFTRVLLVTLPEATPVHEAAALDRDLRRSDIAPYAWVVNQSLAAADTTDPLLRTRAAAEMPHLGEAAGLGQRLAVVAWRADPLVGIEGLAALVGAEPAREPATTKLC